MKKTTTSSFGVGKRERHDASSFYSRSLYDGMFAEPVSKKDLKDIPVSPIGDWADKIYCMSSENMSPIPDNSVALAFTSPPYNVGKDYEGDVSLQDYLDLIRNVGSEVFRVLRPGGRYVINIANLGRKPYIPIHSFFYDIHSSIGFLAMGEIIWVKAEGAGGNCAWGSWQSAKSPRLRDVHEYLLVFAKQSFDRPENGKSDISSTEFMDATLSVWNNILSESATRVQHPAPFPVQLAERVIQLYSFIDDVVLDPFVGSGTTCVAANIRNRHYVGFDISPEYCKIAERRIKGKGKTYMPSEKTECSELSVAFGLLGIKNPLEISAQQLEIYFEGTLSPEKHERFLEEFGNPTNSKTYRQLLMLGSRIRSGYSPFANLANLRWCGPQKQAKSDSGAKDLIAANMAISIKANSNVVYNLSPSHLFESLSQGSAPVDRSENWYLRIDPLGYQELYAFVRNIRLERFPATVDEFEHVASKRDREQLQSEIAKLNDGEKEEFEKKYLAMCHRVAETSAKLFNNNISIAMRGPSRNAIVQDMVRHLFRLDFFEYITAGVNDNREYAIKMPSLSQWTREWQIIDIKTIPDLNRGQSVVDLIVRYRNKKETTDHEAKFQAQIRWSHGKFGQSPEAKLYRRFKWSEIPFVEVIL